MRTRGVLSIAIIVILLASMIPIQNNVELAEEKIIFFADSEPELLISTGSSSGHVNGTKIESTPMGLVVAGDTRNSLNLGGIQLQATSAYNQIVDADSYVALVDEQGVWQWAVMPMASQGLTFIEALTTSNNGEIYIAGTILGQVDFGSNPNSPSLLSQNLDGFVAKLDPTGQWEWAISFQTASNNDSN